MLSQCVRCTIPTVVLAGLVPLSLTVTGCGNGGSSNSSHSSHKITFEEFQTQVLGGDVSRLEIDVLPGGPPFIASEVEIEDLDDIFDEEEVESRITALVLNSGGGSLTLELGGIQVTFDAATEFELKGGAKITLGQFVSLVQDALSQSPPVFLPLEAERPPLRDPVGNIIAQSPDDPVFAAAEIEFEDEEDGHELEINVSPANLLEPGERDCDPSVFGSSLLGCLEVLGVTIGLQEGVTEFEADLPGIIEEEFEAIVNCATLSVAGPNRGLLSLTDGTMIEIDLDTEIEDESGDDDNLLTLFEVQAACNDGLTVEAEGEGELLSSGVIRAIEVEFEVEDEDD